MSDTVPTPPETEGEERWTLWRCPTCGQVEMEPEAVDLRTGEPVCEWHAQEGTRRLEPIEAVPLARLTEAERLRGMWEAAARDEEEQRLLEKARAEAAERERDQAWTEAEEYSQDIDHWQAVHRSVAARAEVAETALREVRVWLEACDHMEECPASSRKETEPCLCGLTQVLKRARTTTTEGERDG